MNSQIGPDAQWNAVVINVNTEVFNFDVSDGTAITNVLHNVT